MSASSFTAVNGQLRISKTVQLLKWTDCAVKSEELVCNRERASAQCLSLVVLPPGKGKAGVRIPNSALYSALKSYWPINLSSPESKDHRSFGLSFHNVIAQTIKKENCAHSHSWPWSSKSLIVPDKEQLQEVIWSIFILQTTCGLVVGKVEDVGLSHAESLLLPVYHITLVTIQQRCCCNVFHCLYKNMVIQFLNRGRINQQVKGVVLSTLVRSLYMTYEKDHVQKTFLLLLILFTIWKCCCLSLHNWLNLCKPQKNYLKRISPFY